MPTVAEAAVLSAADQVGAPDVSTSDAAQSRMRRVASAPAFKHASCYQEVSPTAAVAAAAVSAAAPPHRRQRIVAQPRSVPPCSCCSGGRCNCLEVYVVSRSFSEFGGPVIKRLHPDAREHLVDMGICHYMTVFKTPDGRLVQFDFGPLGGDVQKAHGPLAALLRRARAAAQQQQQDGTATCEAGSFGSRGSQQPSSSSSLGRGLVHSPSAPSLPLASLDLAREAGGESAASLLQDASEGLGDRPKRGVAGEIRERTLQELPTACMYMGRTSLSLDDIRHYNAAQGPKTYTLHENDCRHYVNSLVQYTTGVERSTQHLKRHYFHSRHADKWLWYGWFISASQLVTDVGNWSHIQAGAAVTLLAVTGRSTLASLKTLATPVLPALKSLPVLLPSAGLSTAAAGAAVPGAAAAATAGAGGGSVVLGALATTLKLPATLLLRRPLAAGAAAGSAGAAAAAMRDTQSTAAVAAAASGSGSSGGPPRRGLARSWRPLQSLGDGMAHGFRSAMLGLRRLALGNTRAVQLQQQALTVPEAAHAGTGSAASGRGFWGGSSRQQQQQGRGWFRPSAPANGNHLQLVRHPASMLAAPAAVAAGGTGGVEGQQQPRQQQQQLVQQPARPLVQISQHVLGWGSAAARALGHQALLVGGAAKTSQTAAAATSSGLLMQSASSHQLQDHRQLQNMGLDAGHRSLSVPSLLDPPQDAAAPVASAGSGAALVQGSGVQAPSSSPSAVLGGPDLTFMWDAGSSSSSSITSGSAGSRASGVGRQVLNLPAPRISWGKRASQAMIVRQ